MPNTYRITHWIGGSWTDAPTEDERRSPADPTDLVAKIARGSAKDVDAAVRAAEAAQPEWAAATGPQRGTVLRRAGQLLRERLDEAAVDLVREEGKTIGEARGEVTRAADILDFFGGECWRVDGATIPSATPDTHVFTRREPLGVVGLITPWNFPIAIPTWKVAPALAAGNAVVLKPAQLTTVSTRHLAMALHDAGLPAGALALVHGAGAVVGSAVVDHPSIAAVSFTGSNAVGRDIERRAAARGIRVQLEMGGKNPVVVLDDADPQVAADIAASSAFGLTGQACTATSRVVCTPGIRAELVDALAALARDVYQPGDPQEAAVRMGPVVSRPQLQTDVEYVRIAQDEGARVVCGTTQAVDGQLFAPVVLDGVEVSHRVAQEEVFGPVLAVIDAADEADAVLKANAVPFGLSASIVTQNLGAVARFVAQAQVGVVKVNRPTGGVDLNVPFGGVKESSSNTYREQGSTALDFYSWTKSVYVGFA